jgi:predicted RNA-binding Zn ribbon-like protein
MVSADIFDAEELPLLGEPIAVEFANSLYEGSDETIDFLSNTKNVSLWFRTAEGAQDIYVPGKLSQRDLEQLHELRAVMRSLFIAAAAKETLPTVSIRELNRFAGIAPSYSMLVARGDAFVVSTVASAPTADGLLGRLAHEAIALLGENYSLLRRCEAPGCPMLFLQDHHRRRWCHESCGHRSRQSAYYQRKIARNKSK